MNYYSLLPLSAFFISVSLCIFALRANSRSRLNQIFSLFMLSTAIWGLSSFLIYNSPSPEDAFLWDKTETFGAILAASFMLNFCLSFTRSRLVKVRPFLALMYVPALFFTYVNVTTRMLTYAQEPSYWGYRIIPGSLYYPFTLFMTAYAVASVSSCIIFFLRSKSRAERRQALLLTTGIMVMIAGGVASEVVMPLLEVEVMPLTSTLTALNGGLIAYAMLRYKLMVLTPSLAAENILRTITDYLLVFNRDGTVAFLSDSSISALGCKNRKHLTGKLGEVFRGKSLEDVIRKIDKDGHVQDQNLSVMTSSGKEIPVSLNGSLVRGGAGETLGYVLVMRDMTRVNELIRSLEERTRETESSKKELEKSKRQLEMKIAESERLNKLSVGRELKMVELKKRVEELEKKAGKGK